jgi:hypothetical protein
VWKTVLKLVGEKLLKAENRSKGVCFGQVFTEASA